MLKEIKEELKLVAPLFMMVLLLGFFGIFIAPGAIKAGRPPSPPSRAQEEKSQK